MIEIDDRNYAETVAQTPGLLVLDFGATWCQPCKKIEPILAELATVYDGRATIAHCDVARGPVTAQRFKVMSVPTVVFLKGGEPVDRFIGLQSRDKIVAMIEKHL
jgi:thioredoxin 1